MNEDEGLMVLCDQVLTCLWFEDTEGRQDRHLRSG
jgi:hypothetical protein